MMCTMILQENRGEPPRKRIRKATKDLQEKLLYLCEARKNGDKSVEDFLHGISHCIRLCW